MKKLKSFFKLGINRWAVELILIVVFSFVLSVNTYALSDTFDNYSNNWLYFNNDVTFQNGSMVLSSSNSSFPYIVSKFEIDNYASLDFEINIRFKYLRSGASGDGISIGYTGGTPYNFTIFGLWLDNAEDFQYYYNDFTSSPAQGRCLDFSNTNELPRMKSGKIFKNPFEFHDLTIKYSNKYYEFYMDGMEDQNLLYKSPQETLCVPKSIWFGHYLSGSANWSNLEIDNFEIKTIGTLEPKKRYVVVPGLGASWNPEAMMLGTTTNSDWKMTPYINHYDNLVSVLTEKTGEVPLVWNYDWRQPIEQIVPQFDQFINENVGVSEKVEIVGHSLGGLVGRIWKQDNLTNPRADKVITLGSPHLGTVKAYEAWMGGQISGKLDAGAVATRVLLLLNRFKAKTEVEVLRTIAPITRDLLPVFNFASYKGKELAWNQMKFPNTFMSNKNTFPFNENSLATIVANNGTNTLGYLRLVEPSLIDKALGYWQEGKPEERVFEAGDGTVLTKSANLLGTKLININSDHGQIPNNSRSEILEELQLGAATFDNVAEEAENLYFYLGSPAVMSVKCDKTSEIEDENGWVVMPKADNKNCEVKLTGTGNGAFHLITGSDGEWNKWDAWEGNISISEEKKWRVETDNNILRPIGKTNWWERAQYLVGELLKKYPNNPQLKNSMKFIGEKKLVKLRNQVIRFRSTTREIQITSELIRVLAWLGDEEKWTQKEIGIWKKLVWMHRDDWGRNFGKNWAHKAYEASNIKLVDMIMSEAQLFESKKDSKYGSWFQMASELTQEL